MYNFEMCQQSLSEIDSDSMGSRVSVLSPFAVGGSRNKMENMNEFL